MPRRKLMSSIEAEICTLKKRISAAKIRYEKLCQELEKRQQKRDVIMAQELVRAMRKSGKTYHEVMTFLHPS